MRFGMVVFSASVTEKMGESVNRDEANYAGPLNREKNRNVHNLGPTNRKPRACSAVNSKENSDLFPFPLHPSTLCTLNSPHPRDVTSPTLESFFCQSVGSTRRWRIYIYIYIYGGTTVRRANCFRNGTLAGAKGSFKGK